MFTYQQKVRYSELDQSGRLSIPNIVNYFQDCSNAQSLELGLGYDFFSQKGFAWIMSFWQIVIEERPAMGEVVEVGTFPYEFKRFMGFRNFFLKDDTNHMIVKANSIWALMDMQKGQMVLPTEEMYKKYPLCERLDMDYASRKVKMPSQGEFVNQIKVRRDDLDTNHHLNNAKFIAIALEALPIDFEVRELSVEYKRQAYEGDVLYLYVSNMVDGTGICLKNKEDDIYLNVYVKERTKGEAND